MNRRVLDAIVIGGGPVGAAAALALARDGAAVAIIEAREPQPWSVDDPLDLRVFALAPSSAKLLDELGAWRMIADARAAAYSHMQVVDAASGAQLDFDAAAAGANALGWIVENRLLQHALWQQFSAARVRCHCPTRVVNVSVTDDHVRVTLDDDSAVTARLLVAADGGASPLRERLGIETTTRDYGQRAVVAHVRGERPHHQTAWQRFLPDGPLALLPLADGRSSLVWSLPAARAAEVMALDDAAFMAALGAASDFHLGPIRCTTPRAAFPLRLQLAQRFAAPRAVLVGDAAHVVHPLAGQGVNLGLRDVAELRAVARDARARGRDLGAPDVLARYARRRRADSLVDTWSIDALARIFAWRAPPLIAARGLGVRLVAALPPLKRILGTHARG